jgi:signal transduction histidine kinase
LIEHNHLNNKKSFLKGHAPGFRGFTLQLFLITVLPLTVLLLVVAFGSQALHHEAMRSLVGDRDLRTVRAAASSLEREVSHVSSSIQILSRTLNGNPEFDSLLLTPEEISAIFDGGIALYASNGDLLGSSTNLLDWQSVPTQVPFFFAPNSDINVQPKFSSLISYSGNPHAYIFVSTWTAQNEVLVGAFTPQRLIEDSIGSLVSSGLSTVLVISPIGDNGKFDVLFSDGPLRIDIQMPSHPGIQEVLNGESGINYYQSSEGEHVVAFTPILATGWGVIIEEAWEDIASPSLVSTQSAPLLIVPVFLLALLVIWFGARRIVTPLQKLEKQASSLARGDFEAIRQPVGGIDEIQNLQAELVEMADKLNAAQQSLRSYIGSITAGVENERLSLARELHDDTIQSLIALNQRIQMVLMNSAEPQDNPLIELQNLVQQSMTNLRRIIRGLRPIYLEDLGLVASLEMLVREMEHSGKLSISFVSKGKEQRLNSQSEMSLYRMVQESLNNIVHHAEATHAQVVIIYSGSSIRVEVHDDGKGFNVPGNTSELPGKGHFGLLGLHERAELINAKLEIKSVRGKGTTVLIQIINPNKDNNN